VPTLLASAPGKLFLSKTLTRKTGYLEYFQHFLAPEMREMMAKSGHGEDEINKNLERGAPGFVRMLKAMSAEVPKFNADASRATYDLRAVHFEGMPTKPSATFIKVDGHWYISDQEPGASR
jgi:hypothetical protein